MLRVLVCGGRDYDDTQRVFGILSVFDPEVIIEGGATGADDVAAAWAEEFEREVETFEADWMLHGKAAGPIRNQKMLDEGRPDLVIAFPGGKGTADMVRRARKAGVPVMEVPDV